MTRLTVQLTITFESALSIGAGGSAGTIADKSIVRDGWGRPLIPGSQVKGKLRWAAEQLLRGMGQDIPAPFDAEIEDKQTLVRELFGSPQHRSPLHFADLPATIVAAGQAPAMQRQLSQIRPSVSINRRRGVAEDQRLLFQEIALEGMQFGHERAIVGELPSDMAKHYAALLWAALKLTDRWGGAKSRGLGWATIDSIICLDGQAIRESELANMLRDVLAAPGGG
jgi:CRISPR/Cas system CSM-associated protein Csm3 (group 7 of RAMP superfamily)